MFKRVLVALSVVIFAFAVLLTSVLRSASVKYVFSQSVDVESQGENQDADAVIDYEYPYPGRVTPDSPFWPIKALRDKVWMMLTTNPSRKAELSLLFADKRMVMSKTLFEKDKAEIAYSTLSKAEKYLEEACLAEEENRKNGLDTAEFLTTLSKAALKHQQTINEILEIAPEDAKPDIRKTQDYSVNTYNKAKYALQEKGLPVVENPFESE